MPSGKFITLEGIEGTGKSTNLAFMKEQLLSLGLQVETTREPGGTPFAEEVRELLLAPREEPVSSKAELLLMFAARAQHLETKILPLLEKGIYVLSDRFTDATYAYQGGGRELPWQDVALLENYVQNKFRPDFTLLLTIDPALGMRRASKRGALDRFEQEKLTFYARVQAAYLARAAEDPERFCILDSSQPLATVRQQIAEQLQLRFGIGPGQ